MQLGPGIQHTVASLTIFQRSPHWAAPFEQFRKEVPDPCGSCRADVAVTSSSPGAGRPTAAIGAAGT